MADDSLQRSDRDLLIRIDTTVLRMADDIKNNRDDAVRMADRAALALEESDKRNVSRFEKIESRVSKTELSLAKLMGIGIGSSLVVNLLFKFLWH